MECKFWIGTDIRGRFREAPSGVAWSLTVPVDRLQGAITDLRMLLREVEEAHRLLNGQSTPENPADLLEVERG